MVSGVCAYFIICKLKEYYFGIEIGPDSELPNWNELVSAEEKFQSVIEIELNSGRIVQTAAIYSQSRNAKFLGYDSKRMAKYQIVDAFKAGYLMDCDGNIYPMHAVSRLKIITDKKDNL